MRIYTTAEVQAIERGDPTARLGGDGEPSWEDAMARHVASDVALREWRRQETRAIVVSELVTLAERYVEEFSEGDDDPRGTVEDIVNRASRLLGGGAPFGEPEPAATGHVS